MKRDADRDIIRAKYTELVRRYHPDSLSRDGLGQEILDLAATISSKLNEAYQTLTNEQMRGEYDALLSDDRVQGSATKQVALAEAEKKFRMAQILLKKRDFEKARDMLTGCADAVPKDGRFKAWLAWSLWQDPTLLQDVVAPRVVELLNDAVKLADSEGDPHYFLAVVSRVTGDLSKAAKHFKKCIELNPNHHEAMRELRLMKMRSSKR